MPPAKKKKRGDTNTIHFDIEDILTPEVLQAPTFSVESISADGRRVHKETHAAAPPSPLKKLAVTQGLEVRQEGVSNSHDASDPNNIWDTYDFGSIGAQTFQVQPVKSKKKRYLSSVRLFLYLMKLDD